MKIVVILRTLNEEHNIANFCRGYGFCDNILLADGGSEDRTIEIARTFSNVQVRHFTERVPTKEDSNQWMNPEPKHINFLIDWATEIKADWILLDDCDSFPNPSLARDARQLIEETKKYAIAAKRIYLWKGDSYFPKITVGHSQWGWCARYITVRLPETANTLFDVPFPGVDSPLELDAPPYALVHNFCPNDEIIDRKKQRYKSWGHPQSDWLSGIYAPPEPIPEWVLS